MDGIQFFEDHVETTDDVVYVSEEGEDAQSSNQRLDESDEDSNSLSSSIASGPSLLDRPYPEEPSLCQACLELYMKAKTSKQNKKVKDRLRDNDPRSLTCDEWLLLKKWKPSRQANTRGIPHQLGCKFQFSKRARVQDEEPPGCSRQHPFLQRNIRRVKLSLNKRMKNRKNKKKRTRSDSKVSQAANDHNGTVSSCEDPPEQTAPKKARTFRDRLARLQGCMMFRETL